jgi:hypothetical protein
VRPCSPKFPASFCGDLHGRSPGGVRHRLESRTGGRDADDFSDPLPDPAAALGLWVGLAAPGRTEEFHEGAEPDADRNDRGLCELDSAYVYFDIIHDLVRAG